MKMSRKNPVNFCEIHYSHLMPFLLLQNDMQIKEHICRVDHTFICNCCESARKTDFLLEAHGFDH